MAIQKSITDSSGTTHAEAYIVITGVLINKNNMLGVPEPAVRLAVRMYHDAAARSKADPSSAKVPFMTVNSVPEASDVATYFADSVLEASGKAPFKQAYACLKTQDNEWGIDFTTGTTDV